MFFLVVSLIYDEDSEKYKSIASVFSFENKAQIVKWKN